MKERWGISQEKLVAAEEGLKPAEPVKGGSICSCDRLIQYAKLVLYVELILFLGWSSYTLWQAYDQQAESRFFNVFRSGPFHDVESSTVPTEVLKSLSLKDFKDTEDEIKTTENSPFEEDIFPTGISLTDDQLNVQTTTTRNVHSDGNFVTASLDTTTRNTKIKDSLESWQSDEDNETIIKVPSLGASESNETDNLEESSVIEWGFPFLWSIHKESGPFTNDSSEAVREFRLDDVLDHLYDSNEKDESNDMATFRQTSSEKGINQRNDKDESNFSSEEVPSFSEIVNNLNKLYKSIEAARKDLDLEHLRDDGFLESLKNSNKDETSDPPKSTGEEDNGPIMDRGWRPYVDYHGDTDPILGIGNKRFLQTTIASPRWFHDSEDHSGVEVEDKYKNRETVTVGSNEEDNGSIMDRGWWRPLVDYHGDTDPILGRGNKRFLQTTIASPRWFHDSEDHSGVEVEDKNKIWEIITEATNEEDNDSYFHSRWEPSFTISDEFGAPLPTENVDSESSNAFTNEEDNSSVMDSEWEPAPYWFHDMHKPSQVESVNSEKETIQFGPRETNEDLTESLRCIITVYNGTRVIECSQGTAVNDHSSDSSHTTESESDSFTEGDLTSLRENDGFSDIIKKMHAQDNMESSDEKSDIYDSSVIDKEESIKPASSPEDSIVTSTMFLYKIATTTASSMTKDSTVSPSEINRDLSSEQTTTILEHEDASVDKMNDETLVQKWMRNHEIMKETIQSFTNEDWDKIMAEVYPELLKAHNGTLHERFSQESQDRSL